MLLKNQQLLTRIRKLYATQDDKPTVLQPKIGLSSSAMSEWQKGKGTPSLDSCMKISKFFEVSMDWLVYGDDNDTLYRHPYDDDAWLAKYQPSATSHLVPHTPAYSPEEKEYLYKFRNLTPAQRNKVIGYMEALLGQVDNIVL